MRKEVRKTKIETERITNISELEEIIRDARADAIYLKKAVKDGNKETEIYLVEQIDLKLHQMEAFNFNLERRVVTVED